MCSLCSLALKLLLSCVQHCLSFVKTRFPLKQDEETGCERDRDASVDAGRFFSHRSERASLKPHKVTICESYESHGN